METILKEIANFGFPIVITVYLLLVFQRKINGLGDKIIELKEAITKLIDKIEVDK